MAIQLSERDMMIFKFIEEHQVLLEKHIAWFISCDEKPVLIRDRLRKLFYLDYLLCQRHGGKLPWWTTPTKPLVYILSPLARTIVAATESEADLADNEVQRHLLEIANLRMLFLMDQKAGLIENFHWQTNGGSAMANAICATISFRRNGVNHRASLVNQPELNNLDSVLSACDQALKTGQSDMIWMISRDELHQDELQKALKITTMAPKVAFVTHHEAYKAGMTKARWQSTEKQFAPALADSVIAAPIGQIWSSAAASA